MLGLVQPVCWYMYPQYAGLRMPSVLDSAYMVCWAGHAQCAGLGTLNLLSSAHRVCWIVRTRGTGPGTPNVQALVHLEAPRRGTPSISLQRKRRVPGPGTLTLPHLDQIDVC